MARKVPMIQTRSEAARLVSFAKEECPTFSIGQAFCNVFVIRPELRRILWDANKGFDEVVSIVFIYFRATQSVLG